MSRALADDLAFGEDAAGGQLQQGLGLFDSDSGSAPRTPSNSLARAATSQASRSSFSAISSRCTSMKPERRTRRLQLRQALQPLQAAATLGFWKIILEGGGIQHRQHEIGQLALVLDADDVFFDEQQALDLLVGRTLRRYSRPSAFLASPAAWSAR